MENEQKMIMKHFSDVINIIVKNRIETDFTSLFKETCDNDPLKDTTIGVIYREFKEICVKEVTDYFYAGFDELNLYRYPGEKNSFFHLLWEVWHNFQDRLYIIDEYVEDLVSDFIYDYELNLTEMGVLDEYGMYTGKLESDGFKFDIIAKKAR